MPEPPLVLIVDDDPDILRLVERSLTSLPVRLEVRGQAFGVLNAIAELRPALVILDVMMPAIDGTTITDMVRADPELCATQILLYSALDEGELRQRAHLCGADGSLTKTAGPRRLAREVIERLSLHR